VFKYPKQIKGKTAKKEVTLPKKYFIDFKFDPDFAIRGLHYGTRKKRLKG
jgi:hypothetical protein